MEVVRTNIKLLEECEAKYAIEVIAVSQDSFCRSDPVICFEFNQNDPDIISFVFQENRLSFKVSHLQDVLSFISKIKHS